MPQCRSRGSAESGEDLVYAFHTSCSIRDDAFFTLQRDYRGFSITIDILRGGPRHLSQPRLGTQTKELVRCRGPTLCLRFTPMESDTDGESASGALSRLPDHALGWELHADAGAGTFRARNDNRAAVQLDQTV